MRVVSNSLLQPAKLPIEDFPVRRNIPGPGLTCQNNLECTLFDDCEEVSHTIIEPTLLLRMTAPAELETTWSKTTYLCARLVGRAVEGDR